MKKNIFYILLLFSVFAFQSCLFEDELVFTNSASERLINALKADNDSLQSAPNGWAMEYFATTLSPGYTMLVKFDNAGNAVFAGKSELTNNIYATDTCSYQMIGDAGPMLTFSTYSKILHAFSVPDVYGLGLEGDYEFIVMKATANQIVLKGKKRGTTILLNKLPDNISWPQYIANLDVMNSLLFGNNAPKLTMKLANKYWFNNGSSRVFSILKNGADANTSVIAPFIVTPTGIRFHSAQVLDGMSFQTFTLNADKSALESVDNSNVKLLGPDSLAVYFTHNINVWTINPQTLGATLRPTYDLLVQSLLNKYNATNVKLSLKFSASRISQVLMLSFTSGKTKIEGNLDVGLTVDGQSKLSITYKGTGDKNGINFYTNIKGFKEIAALLSNSFEIVTDATINPKNIKFTQKQDANFWFSVTAE